jgi:hypothetical protein
MKSASYRALTAAALMLLSGCASTGGGLGMDSVPGLGPSAAQAWTPTVDQKGLNQAQYEKDFAECKAVAVADPSTDGNKAAKKGAMKWGLGSAAGMAALTIATGGAAAIPLMAGTLAVAGGAGALSGGMSNKLQADWRYQGMITQCLKGRGYNVLG